MSLSPNLLHADTEGHCENQQLMSFLRTRQGKCHPSLVRMYAFASTTIGDNHSKMDYLPDKTSGDLKTNVKYICVYVYNIVINNSTISHYRYDL